MMDTKVFGIIASVILFWTTADVVQGKYIYHSEINRWVKQDKVVATWEQAKIHCESEGAVLASPINEDLIKYMTSIIDVDHHESPYFIGMKLIQNTEVFKSIEGTLLDDLPEAIINKIDKLDPREGECLGMSRSNIHVVPCWSRLPYLCYLNTTTNSPIYVPTTTSRPVTEQSTTPSWWQKWTTVVATTSDESTDETTDCGYGYKRYSTGSCYKVHEEYKSWDEAHSICSDEGGYLAIINDANEAEFLKSISFRYNYGYIRKWIGLRKNYGVWHSVHGDSLDQIFNVWSNTVSGLPCGALKNDGLLDDQSCTFEYGFICEKSLHETSTRYTPQHTVSSTSAPQTTTRVTYTTAPTLSGYESNCQLGSCYKVHEEYKSWYEAESICSDEGGYLAIINDANEAEFLKSISFRLNDWFIRKWIGLQRNGRVWQSVHGDSLDQLFNIWSDTVSGLPCGVLKTDGLLDDQSCAIEYGFICEKSMQTLTTPAYIPRYESISTRLPPRETYSTSMASPTGCGSGYEFNDQLGSCYKVHDDYKSWDEAQSTCSDEGGYLAVINNANEAEFLKSITTRPFDQFVRKWIGLRNIDGDWRSVHGDSVDQIFNVWSDTVSGLPCGVLKNDGLLDDQTCNFNYRFICEKSLQETSTRYTSRHNSSSTPLPTTTKPFYEMTTATLCRSGYEFSFQLGSCYKVHDEYKSFDEAESTCSNEGAYLAVINDADEAEYLQRITSRPNDKYMRKWIGLRKIDGDWRSVRGDHFDQIFNLWSDTVSGLPCGVLKDDGLLDDQSCNFEYRFICETSVLDPENRQHTNEYTPRYDEPTTTPTETIVTTTYRPPDCGSEYKFYSGQCYKVHDEYKTWDEAKSTCARENGYLAVINDANEAQVLQNITSRPNDDYRRKWIGLQNIDGDWRSVHGDSLDQLFHVWSDSVSGLPCGAFKDDGMLDDQSCDFKYRFICEHAPYWT